MRIQNVEWDNWNVQHIARHEVTPIEVEWACYDRPLIKKAKDGRILFMGKPRVDGIC